MKKNPLLTFFFCILFFQNILAQLPQACPSPPPPGAENCQDACIVCSGLDGFTGTNNGTPSGGNTICGQIAVHNDQWMGFVAGNDSITITVVTSNCQNGDGFQMAIFGKCSDPDAIVCNPGTPGGGGIDLILEYNDYKVGEPYFLMVDGWSGDVCEYTISVSPPNAMQAPALGNVVGGIQGPATVCPGKEVIYSISEVANAAGYLWSAPPGSQINGQNQPLEISGAAGATVIVTIGASGGQICVKPVSPCLPAGQQACKTISTQPIPPTVLPQETICAGETYTLPWGEVVTEPGTYMIVLSSQSGCDSVVQVFVSLKPPIEANLGTQYICQGACFQLGDSLYCTQGFYTPVLNSYQGCDSTVFLNLVVLPTNSAAFVEAPQGQTITCANPILTLQSQGLSGVLHLWKNTAGDTLGTGNSIEVTAPGFYFHEVSITDGGITCSAQSKILIKQNNTPPPFTAKGGTLDASHPTVQLVGNSIISGVTYAWTGPGGFTSNKRNPIVSVPGLYTLTVTNPQTGCSSSKTVVVLMMI